MGGSERLAAGKASWQQCFEETLKKSSFPRRLKCRILILLGFFYKKGIF